MGTWIHSVRDQLPALHLCSRPCLSTLAQSSLLPTFVGLSLIFDCSFFSPCLSFGFPVAQQFDWWDWSRVRCSSWKGAGLRWTVRLLESFPVPSCPSILFFDGSLFVLSIWFSISTFVSLLCMLSCLLSLFCCCFAICPSMLSFPFHVSFFGSLPSFLRCSTFLCVSAPSFPAFVSSLGSSLFLYFVDFLCTCFPSSSLPALVFSSSCFSLLPSFLLSFHPFSLPSSVFVWLKRSFHSILLTTRRLMLLICWWKSND